MNLKTNLVQLLILIPFLMQAQSENKITSKFDFIPGEKVIFYDDFSQ
jgi:OOP family OmpA-OmpF porin